MDKQIYEMLYEEGFLGKSIVTKEEYEKTPPERRESEIVSKNSAEPITVTYTTYNVIEDIEELKLRIALKQQKSLNTIKNIMIFSFLTLILVIFLRFS